ncbi:hypothetical protein ACKKBG_A22030 [Auxenochlorella protothecoides x Auxenochlorella symbiontica]
MYSAQRQQLASKTPENPGRAFFTCARRRKECGFYCWADEVPLPPVQKPEAAFSLAETPGEKGPYGSIPSNYSCASTVKKSLEEAYSQPGRVKMDSCSGEHAVRPEPKNEGLEAAVDQSTDDCLRCGKLGHWMAQCPEVGQNAGPTMQSPSARAGKVDRPPLRNQCDGTRQPKNKGLPAGGGPRLGLSARAKKKQRQRERKRQRAMHAAPVQAKHGASS